MNRKQAVGTLHRLYMAYVDVIPLDLFQSPEHTALREAAHEAFMVLAFSILGKPEPLWCRSLCDFCHEAYGTSC